MMSIFYNIEEHMVIGNRSTDSEYYGILGGHVAMLGALMLCGRVRICRISASTDRGSYEFEGTGVTEELQKIADVTECAEHMDFSASYEYTAYTNETVCSLADPENICRYLQEKSSEIPQTVFYCLYSEADCDTTIGHLQAYGTWMGQKYNGEVAYTDLQEIPEGITLRTPLTAVTLEMDWSDNSDRAAIETVCRELCTLSDYDTLDADGQGISFFLNNVLLKSRADIQKYFALCDELTELTDGECCWEDEFVSINSVNPRIFRAKENNGSRQYQMTTV